MSNCLFKEKKFITYEVCCCPQVAKKSTIATLSVCWLADLNLLNIECDSEKQTETYDVKQNIFNTREGGQPK